MSGDTRRTLRRALFSLVIVGGAAGLILGTSPVPASAAPVAAISQFDAPPADHFPADALGGERNALATDALLLNDPASGAVLRRTENSAGTQLVRGPNDDAPLPPSVVRPRLNPAAVTAAIGATGSGKLSSPFMQRTLSLSFTGSGSSQTGPMLQLTSPSDQAEATGAYTTVGKTVPVPRDGQTYQFNTSVSVNANGHITRNALTATPGVDGHAALVYAVPEGQVPAAAQQWTVLYTASGSRDFQLVNRADGTCFALEGVASVTEVRCDRSSGTQLWQSRPVPHGFGLPGTFGLYNTAEGVWVGYHQATSFPTVAGSWGEPAVWDPAADPTDAAGSLFGWSWNQVQQPTPIPLSVTFPAENRPDFPFALATGDLDGIKGPEGAPREEAVVAYGSDGHLVISVVDYAAGADAPVVTTKKTSIALGQAASGGTYSPVTVSTVDIAGTGLDDIVVTYEDAAGAVYATAARYTRTPGGRGAITLVGSPQALGFTAALTSGGDVYPTAAAAGDFNGDGTQELAWAGATATPGDYGKPWLLTAALHITGDTFTAPRQTLQNIGGNPIAASAGPNTFLQMASGQFQAATTGTGTRQIAVAWAVDGGGKPGGVWTNIFTVRQGQSAATSLFPDEPEPLGGSTGATALSMAVGGFNNDVNGQAANTNWGVAISEPGAAAGGTKNLVTLIQPQTGGTPPVVTAVSVTPTSDSGLAVSGYELTSWDRLGNSLLLGTPIVYTVQQFVNANVIGAQPPTHSDWLPDANDGKPGFVNISRNEDFNLVLGGTSTKTFTNESSQAVNQGYGLTGSADLSTTISVGIPLLDKSEVSSSIAGELTKKSASLTSNVSTTNTTTTKSVTQTTADDDIVDVTVQDFAVYRYPVLSTQTWDNTQAATNNGCAGGCYGFWDVTVPGTPYPLLTSGKKLSFYQPSWQNGDALSYPQLKNGTVPLSNVGSFGYTGTDGTQKTSDAPLVNAVFGVGGNKTTASLDTASSVTDGSTETSTHGWSGSLTGKFGVSAEIKIPTVAGVTGNFSLSAGFTPSTEFADTNTGTTANSHGASFQVNIPAVPSNRGYNIGGAYYYDTSGTSTVNWGVNLDDTVTNAAAAQWWKQQYGQQADPALNLPNATVLDYDPSSNHLNKVEWNPDATRQLLRGFTARMPYGTDPTTSGAQYAQAPAPGDPVVFDVEVSNDSLIAMPTTTTADFYAVPVDADGLDVTTSANNPVIHIGQSTVPALGPQDHTTVSSPTWTAKASPDGSAQNWRIFVLLNQKNANGDPVIPEIHGWAGNGSDTCPASTVQDGKPLVDPMTGKTETLQCGQNDQGFGNLTVMPPTPARAQTRPADVRLTGGGVLTDTPATLNLTTTSAVPTVHTHDTTTVLVRAKAGHTTPAHQTVIVYEGSPKNGNVVAVTQMHGVLANGTSTASFSYTPQTTGVHDLYAMILGTTHSGPNHGIIIRVDATNTTPGNPGGHGNNGSSAGNGGTQPPAGGHTAGTPNGASVNTGGTTPADHDALPWTLAGLGALLALGATAAIRRRTHHGHDDSPH